MHDKTVTRAPNGCEDEYALAHHAGVWVLDTCGTRGRKIQESAA